MIRCNICLAGEYLIRCWLSLTATLGSAHNSEMRTVWTTSIPSATYNGWTAVPITVTTAPATFTFSVDLKVADGYPTVYVLNPSIYSEWVLAPTPSPESFPFKHEFLHPGSSVDTTLVFQTPTTYPVVLYCGSSMGSIANGALPAPIYKDCSGINFIAYWSDLKTFSNESVPVKVNPNSDTSALPTAVLVVGILSFVAMILTVIGVAIVRRWRGTGDPGQKLEESEHIKPDKEVLFDSSKPDHALHAGFRALPSSTE
ncbi:hypothetical protein BJ742DRAFT_451166 [Cladochytrium replicatum]|nr:hypothetical protein BJ742DRAFT_451166 [Cladochytrium replicatum]